METEKPVKIGAIKAGTVVTEELLREMMLRWYGADHEGDDEQDEAEAEADADEAGREGMSGAPTAWASVGPSRHRAQLKSPAILASKDRMRRRRVRKGEARVAKCPDGSSHEFNAVTWRCERCGRSREAAVLAGLKPSYAESLREPRFAYGLRAECDYGAGSVVAERRNILRAWMDAL